MYAVASEDMDSLTFGAPRFLRHLMDPSSKKIPVMEFDIAKVCIVMFSVIDLMLHNAYHMSPNLMLQVLEELELTMDQFIDLCILCGCDYCDSIKGILYQFYSILLHNLTAFLKCISNFASLLVALGIGGQTALKLIRQHGSIESILENLNKDR